MNVPNEASDVGVAVINAFASTRGVSVNNLQPNRPAGPNYNQIIQEIMQKTGIDVHGYIGPDSTVVDAVFQVVYLKAQQLANRS